MWISYKPVSLSLLCMHALIHACTYMRAHISCTYAHTLSYYFLSSGNIRTTTETWRRYVKLACWCSGVCVSWSWYLVQCVLVWSCPELIWGCPKLVYPEVMMHLFPVCMSWSWYVVQCVLVWGCPELIMCSLVCFGVGLSWTHVRVS